MTHKKLRILIVEDHEINQLVLQTMIRNLGCDSIVASDGEEAVNLCRNETFDLIFMDLQMPNMDGYKATTIIRKELRLNIPVYAVTADAYPEDMEHCNEVGMNGVILKPYKQNQLENIINSVQSQL